MSQSLRFLKEEFKALTFNVMEVKGNKLVVNEFKTIGQYPEFSADMPSLFDRNRNKIHKYIVLMYDRNTPLKRIDKLDERKIKAALLAGFKPVKTDRKKHFPEYIDHMMKGYSPQVNAMIVRYCRLQGSHKFALIVAGNEGFYDSIASLLKRSSGDKDSDTAVRQKIFKTAEDNAQRLESLAIELLNEDESLALRGDLFRVIEDEDRKSLRITPESRAEAT